MGYFWKVLSYNQINIEFTPVIKYLTLLHPDRPKLYTILAFLSAIGLNHFYKALFHLQIRVCQFVLICVGVVYKNICNLWNTYQTALKSSLIWSALLILDMLMFI